MGQKSKLTYLRMSLGIINTSMVFVQVSLGTLDYISMVPDNACSQHNGHNRNGFYGPMVCLQAQLATIEVVYMETPLGTIGTICMVSNYISSSNIKHH